MAEPLRPWTDEEDLIMREMHAEGQSLGAVARRLKRAKSTISRFSKAAGLEWDREHTVAATVAKVRDNKARRAELETKLLDDAEKLRGQMWKKIKYIDHGGKDYTRVEWEQREPTPTDKLKLMQAAASALDHSLRIAQHDSDSGVTEATSMLQRLAEALEVPMPGKDVQAELEEIL